MNTNSFSFFTIKVFVLLIAISACSKEEAEPKCMQYTKADLYTSTLTISQADDHHFMFTAQITNLSRGTCATTSTDNYASLKVLFNETGIFSESSTVAFEKTFAISPLAPVEKREIKEVVNLYTNGYYLFVWTLDVQGVVDENIEDNNVAERTYKKTY